MYGAGKHCLNGPFGSTDDQGLTSFALRSDDNQIRTNITFKDNTGFAPSAFGVILIRNSQLINGKENIIDTEGFDETCSEHIGIKP